MRLTVSMWCVLCVAGSGCLTPRSFTVQQMASPVGAGATEVSVFGGGGYISQTNPPTSGVDGVDPVTNQVQQRGFALPGAEANIQQGFSDHLALNIHASTAGIQPGLKITVNKSRNAHFALLPAIALGYSSIANSTYQSRADGRLIEVNPTSTTSFSLLAGFKMLASHRIGIYGGVGYDLMLHRTLTQSAPNLTVDRTDTITVTLGHQISFAIGWDIALGRVHLRPEIAAAVYPGFSQSFTTRVGSTTNDSSVGGGFGWAIMPGLGIAVASEPKRDDPELDGASVEGEEDDEEEEPRPKKKARRRSAEEEEEDDARRKRRPIEEDE